MPRGTCILCGQEADLQLSHILPAFAFRWMRESSGNGHIRLGMEPNQRVQDESKRHWMCSKCERRLNWSETRFSRKLFHPYLAASHKPLPYSRWLIHFCTSLSWRVLRFYRDEIGLKIGKRKRWRMLIKPRLHGEGCFWGFGSTRVCSSSTCSPLTASRANGPIGTQHESLPDAGDGHGHLPRGEDHIHVRKDWAFRYSWLRARAELESLAWNTGSCQRRHCRTQKVRPSKALRRVPEP